jgi:hypothetical protein
MHSDGEFLQFGPLKVRVYLRYHSEDVQFAPMVAELYFEGAETYVCYSYSAWSSPSADHIRNWRVVVEGADAA